MKVLITAGPTWTKIDDVRILTNIFTGRTGVYLAKVFKEKGLSVTLILNPYRIKERVEGIRVIPFHYYNDLKEKITKELKKNKYDVIIHSAAVSDYKMKHTLSGKISSRKRRLALVFSPTAKIIKVIRRLAKGAVLVQFKLETDRKGLLKRAYSSLKENKADYVVANALEGLRLGYRAFIIDSANNVTGVNSRQSLAHCLYRIIRPKIKKKRVLN